jgi:hypothetical protein
MRVARARSLAAVAAVFLLSVLTSAAAAKPVTIAGPGTAAGQVAQPVGVGVNFTTQNVYVSDYQNFRVQELRRNGEYLTEADLSVQPLGLAVDQVTGDVWVTNLHGELLKFGPSLEVLGKFEEEGEQGGPVAVDEAGNVWVGGNEVVREYDQFGGLIGSVSVTGVGRVRGLAVSEEGPGVAAGDLFVIGSDIAGVSEFEVASGKQVGGVVDAAGAPLAIDRVNEGGVEELFVGGESAGSPYSFKEFSAAGVQLEQFGADEVIGHPGEPEFENGYDAIAVDPPPSAGEQGVLYSASTLPIDASAVQRFALPSEGPLPEDEEASEVRPTSVVLKGSLDPEDHQTEYKFEYGTQPGAYGQSTEAKSLLGVEWTAEPVAANIKGLLPETTYYFRLTASNHCVDSDPTRVCVVNGEGGEFTTPPAVKVESESVLDVSSGAAEFEGVLNPQEASGQWWIEYGNNEGELENEEHTGKEALAAVNGGVSIIASVQGLDPSSVYFYRFAASDEREGHSYVSKGAVRSFTTQAESVASSLPDGRAWEMVSPLVKQNASFAGLDKEGAINQAAAEGGAFTYAATASIEAAAEGEPSFESVQVLSRHDAGGGWSSRDIASPHQHGWIPQLGKLSEFFAFSSDLSVGLVDPRGNTLLGSASERTPYLRRQVLCENSATNNECYLPLLTSSDVSSGEKWGGAPDEPLAPVEYEASTPDLSHIVLLSPLPLTTGAAEKGVYEWSSDGLELVSVLPGEPGTPAGGCPSISKEAADTRHGVSTNGDRVVWENPLACSGGGHVYLHEVGSHRSVQLDVRQGGSPGEIGRAVFEDASSDDSRVFFNDVVPLTFGSNARLGAPELFVFEANGDNDVEPGVVRDVTEALNRGESGGVLGVAGASTDGSVVYVVASGVLSRGTNAGGEVAQAGEPNLYRIERVEEEGKVNWIPSFIATISQGDDTDWSHALAHQTTSVSPNGRWFVFMSDRSLTGYDNRDAVSGEADEEVFLYDGLSGRLVCVSCDPSGARPDGTMSFGEISLADKQDSWKGRWLAGLVPSWDASGDGVGVYQPRYLSDSGRVFFDSVDGLVPQDVNGNWDVYEFEPVGVGLCSVGSAGFISDENGCVGLVSSGIASEETVLLDASESGSDVFFLTSGKLVSGDTDNAFDVYDAHMCGVSWECSPSPAVIPPCTNTSSCRGAPEAQPTVFGAPSSATFSGAGNPQPQSRSGKPKKSKHTRRRHTDCARKHARKDKRQCMRARKSRRRAATRVRDLWRESSGSSYPVFKAHAAGGVLGTVVGVGGVG